MVGVGIAIATAGVIVGAVGSTGLSTNLIVVIESVAKDNVAILLLLTIILCLLLGMGLPTTANYVVVASLMAMVLVDVGNASGFVFPLIAVHLFVFYFGLMADVTPPVGLASYAAAAISGGDPLKTGVQAFWYSLRTGILPIVFLFNHELLLIGIENIWHALLVIVTSLIGILVFTAATQRWFFNKLRWYEIIVFLFISISLLSPEFVLNKFYPKYNYKDINQIQLLELDPKKEVRFKVTRPSEYGERYKLFVIEKNTFGTKYNLDDLTTEQKALFYALARQESRFIPASVSRSYALGAMQMMPFLIRSMKGDVFNQFDYNENVILSVKHQKWLFSKLNDPLMVAYAYNGGIGFVNRKVLPKFKYTGKYEPFSAST